MRKLLTIIICFMLCSCIVKYDRNDPVEVFPKLTQKKSIALVINDPTFTHQKYAKRFEKSNLFSKVILGENEKTDYTLFISRNSGTQKGHCLLSSFISGLTFLILPSVCNYEDAIQINLKLKNNHTEKVQNNYYISGSWGSIGILPILAMPFTDNIFYAEGRIKDNIILRTYYMMESFK